MKAGIQLSSRQQQWQQPNKRTSFPINAGECVSVVHTFFPLKGMPQPPPNAHSTHSQVTSHSRTRKHTAYTRTSEYNQKRLLNRVFCPAVVDYWLAALQLQLLQRDRFHENISRQTEEPVGPKYSENRIKCTRPSPSPSIVVHRRTCLLILFTPPRNWWTCPVKPQLVRGEKKQKIEDNGIYKSRHEG